MRKTTRFEIEGAILEVPLYYDKFAKMSIERYPDLLRHPVYTPEGYRVMITIEDACPHAEMVNDAPLSIDCGACKHYRQAPGTLLGVCHCEAMRRKASPEGKGAPK